jgi:hypothetical protein
MAGTCSVPAGCTLYSVQAHSLLTNTCTTWNELQPWLAVLISRPALRRRQRGEQGVSTIPHAPAPHASANRVAKHDLVRQSRGPTGDDATAETARRGGSGRSCVLKCRLSWSRSTPEHETLGSLATSYLTQRPGVQSRVPGPLTVGIITPLSACFQPASEPFFFFLFFATGTQQRGILRCHIIVYSIVIFSIIHFYRITLLGLGHPAVPGGSTRRDGTWRCAAVTRAWRPITTIDHQITHLPARLARHREDP